MIVLSSFSLICQDLLIFIIMFFWTASKDVGGGREVLCKDSPFFVASSSWFDNQVQGLICEMPAAQPSHSNIYLRKLDKISHEYK